MKNKVMHMNMRKSSGLSLLVRVHLLLSLVHTTWQK